jgi:chemotaxis family two-component system sensor kinase Cph1
MEKERWTETVGVKTLRVPDKELDECDRMQLQFLGKIQGLAGHVIFVKYPTSCIVAVDARIQDLDWIKTPKPSASAMLGTSLQSWIPADIFGVLLESMRQLKRDFLSRTFHFFMNHAITVSTTSPGEDLISIEIERNVGNGESRDFHTALTYLSRSMDFFANQTIVKMACDAIFNIVSDFDRGMVYRFNDDLSGEIIHEVRRGDLESCYLGHRFPAGDIPQSSRELYVKNVFRYIRDVNEQEVPVLSHGDQEIDLTQIRSRAVAKPHVIYMRNMGVRCSMSLAIIVKNELWGLFAFHGYKKAFKPSLHQRIACEAIASMVSSRVETLVKAGQSSRIVRLGESLMRWSASKTFETNLSEMGNAIMDLTEVDVIAGRIGSNTVVVGDKRLAPGELFWKTFAGHPNGELAAVSFRQSIDALGLSEKDCPASGFAYFRNCEIQFFLGRGTRSKDVIWAGNPDEPKLQVDGVLSPRNSFEKFMEKARKESRAWSKADLNVISVLRDRICSGLTHDLMLNLLRSDLEDANIRHSTSINRAEDNSQFFAHMCHELRTPFHGVMGCLNLLHESIESMSPEEVKDLIKTALFSGNHLINVLNDILTESKNKFLTSRLVRNTIVYQTLAREAVDGLTSLSSNAHISFEHDIVPRMEHIVIVTDRTKVLQISTNIINNSMQFAARGLIRTRFYLISTLQRTIEKWENETKHYAGFVFTMNKGEMHTSFTDVKLSTDNVPDKENYKWMCFSVSDSGCGMKAAELEEMFKPYIEGSHGDSRFQGTGLGLYISISLCFQLGGFIACSSTPNVGTVVHVCIPVEVLHPEEEDPAGVENDDILISGPIVVVDDNKVNVKILERALKVQLARARLDVEILTADGGEKAVAIYKERLPSLVIIDYHMPGMNGAEATKAIRKFESDHSLRPSYILSYTADETDAARDLLLSCGSNGIIHKPPPKAFVSKLVDHMIVKTSTEDIGANFSKRFTREN